MAKEKTKVEEPKGKTTKPTDPKNQPVITQTVSDNTLKAYQKN